MKKIKVSIVNQNTLKLEESGEAGDIIDLLALQSIDSGTLLLALEQGKDQVYKQLLAKEIERYNAKRNLELLEKITEYDTKISEVTLEKEKIIAKLESDNKALIATNSKEKEALSLELESKWLKEKSDLEKSNIELKTKLLNSNEKQVLDIQNIKLEVETMYKSKIASLEKEIITVKGDYQLQLSKKDEEKNNKIQELEKKMIASKETYTTELNLKDLEISKLTHSKSTLQIKRLGEELERWCNSEYESYALAGFESCKWFKDNIAISDSISDKASKADYIFQVYGDNNFNNLLTSVVCEMKNEAPDSKTKTKNSEHYKKLENDRIKKGCQYSLLISELEWDVANDSPIKKVAGYDNMYLVRPNYFISFLSLIKSLATKYQELILVKTKSDEMFKESNEILEMFESFKKTYLEKPLEALQKDMSEINKEALKISQSSNKILDFANTITNTRIREMNEKIERFDIRKISRMVSKIESNQEV